MVRSAYYVNELAAVSSEGRVPNVPIDTMVYAVATLETRRTGPISAREFGRGRRSIRKVRCESVAGGRAPDTSSAGTDPRNARKLARDSDLRLTCVERLRVVPWSPVRTKLLKQRPSAYKLPISLACVLHA